MLTSPFRSPGVFTPLLKECFLPGEKGAPILLGCEENGRARAALAALCVEDRAIIRRVCVDKPCIRQGMGRDLVQAFCNAAAKTGLRAVEAYACLPAEKQDAIRGFLQACGFQEEESAQLCAIPLGSIASSRLGNGALSQFTVPLAEAPSSEWRIFLGQLARRGLSKPFSMNGLLRQESMVWMEGGRITGCILLASDGESLEVRWLYAENQKAVMALLAAAYRAASARFSPETTVYAAAAIPSAAEIMKRLGGDRCRNPADVLAFARPL